MMAEALQGCLSRFSKFDTLKAEQIELEGLISGRDVLLQFQWMVLEKAWFFQLFREEESTAR